MGQKWLGNFGGTPRKKARSHSKTGIFMKGNRLQKARLHFPIFGPLGDFLALVLEAPQRIKCAQVARLASCFDSGVL